MPSRKRKKSVRRRRARRRGRLRLVASLLLVLAVIAAAAFIYTYVEIRSRFEGRLWALPSRVYSAPVALSRGATLPRETLVRQFDRLGYGRLDAEAPLPGRYRAVGSTLDVYLRAFEIAGEPFDARRVKLRFAGSEIVSIEGGGAKRLDRVLLEPELLATLHGAQQEERDVVRLPDIPEAQVLAVLAAEDARFYTHRGVDPRAVLRAALANLRSARIVQGGSTITQQTVKNLYLGQERTWWRKSREVVMAGILDWKFSKDRILEVYLNEVYLGQRGSVAICGLQAASRLYFGRDLRDLSLGEQALLAGMIRSPGLYNPFQHPERAVARRDQVLDAMVRLEFIDPADAERARGEKLRLAGVSPIPRARAPWVIDFIRSRLSDLFSSSSLTERGLRIHTTVDPVLQTAAEEALHAGLERLDRDAYVVRKNKGERTLQGMIVALRPSTGEVLAMVGGRDYQESQFNRATQALRQPGSCFKPFVYLAGFENGEITPSTVLEDEPLELKSGGTTWRPVNYDKQFRGPVSARYALEKSLNVPTVRAARRVGLKEVARVAERCGIDREFRPLPALALGAQEVTALELATAFGTIANLGYRTSPLIVQEVTDLEGTPLESRQVHRTLAVSPQSAFLLNHVLQGVMTRGTGASSQRLGFQGIAAGKTGTTDDTRDSWFVGYTPDLLALVWVGYDDNARTGLTGASGALPIWVDFMKRAGQSGSRVAFREPEGIAYEVVDPGTGLLAVRGCPGPQVEVFAEGSEPRKDCTLHKKGFFGRLRDKFRKKE
jgi:penicillin-binding protein 1B